MVEVPVAGIQIKDLTIRYGADAPVLDQLSLNVESGEIVALVGASGCGKTTLLKAIASLLPITSGSLNFTPSEQHRRESEIAYVFQDATLLPWRTAEENVRLPLELAPSDSSRRRHESGESESERIQRVLNAVGLGIDAAKKFPRELSGGMRMRVSLARALVNDPTVLLLDEPFAALDDMLRSRLNDLVLQLHKKRPRTILFVTHNIAEAVFLSDRVVVIGNGVVERCVDNSLAHPRKSQIRSTLEFAELYGKVSEALAGESS